MSHILKDICEDLGPYLDLVQLTDLSLVSTSSLFNGLYNLKFDRFIPSNRDFSLLHLPPGIKNTYILKHMKGSENPMDFVTSLPSIRNGKKCGRNPLCWSAITSNIEIFNAYIRLGVDLDGDKIDNPLRDAVANNNIEMVNLLIENGANVNPSLESGRCLLHDARSVEMANILIEAGANVNTVYHVHGNVATPLDLIIGRCNYKIAHVLKNAGGMTLDELIAIRAMSE